MSNNKDEVTKLLTHYFEVAIGNLAGDNQAEISEIGDWIEKMAEEAVIRVLNRGLEYGKPAPRPLWEARWQLVSEAAKMAGCVDDGGCDWFTDEQGNSYIGDVNWKASSDRKVASMIEAAYLLGGDDVRISMAEVERRMQSYKQEQS